MVDVTKCIGCRKGEDFFIYHNGDIAHLDLFATPEAGQLIMCKNHEVVKDLLVENPNKGTYSPNPELQKFYDEQRSWWDDIMIIIYMVFEGDGTKVAEFFNSGPEDNKMFRRSNKEIEDAVLKLADEAKVEYSKEANDGLLRFKELPLQE